MPHCPTKMLRRRDGAQNGSLGSLLERHALRSSLIEQQEKVGATPFSRQYSLRAKRRHSDTPYLSRPMQCIIRQGSLPHCHLPLESALAGLAYHSLGEACRLRLKGPTLCSKKRPISRT